MLFVKAIQTAVVRQPDTDGHQDNQAPVNRLDDLNPFGGRVGKHNRTDAGDEADEEAHAGGDRRLDACNDHNGT